MRPRVIALPGCLGQLRRRQLPDRLSASATFGPINIDETAPKIGYAGNSGSYTVDQTVDITCVAVDPIGRHRARTPMNRRPLIAAGTLLGIGMGGFVDGITFHQILQLHNMLSAKLPPTTLVNAEINMFWDGLFHAFTWAMTAIGLALLWRAGQRPEVPWSTRTFAGSLSLGWGLFNLVEVVNALLAQ